jgi:hypothetical protein
MWHICLKESSWICHQCFYKTWWKLCENFRWENINVTNLGMCKSWKWSSRSNFQWWINFYILWTSSSNSKIKLTNKLKVNTYVTTLVLGSWPKERQKKQKNGLETTKVRKRLKHIRGVKKKHSWNSWKGFPFRELGIT